jgi:hypothetical protein
MNEQTELAKALVDVRKAYRLLHTYQARALDIIKYVSKKLNVTLQSAWPWYTDTTVSGDKVDLDNWSFDWLPMYLYEFVLFNSKIEGRDSKFSILINSDTGFFDSSLEWKERNKTQLFASPEGSDTQVIFMAGVDKWHKGGPNMMATFKKDAGWNIEKDGTGTFITKAYSLTDFLDADSIDVVMKDFIELTVKNDILFLQKLSS